MLDSLSIVPKTCRVILPTAPIRPVTCNRGKMLTCWYDIITLHRPPEMPLDEILALHNQDQMRETVRVMTDLIDAEVKALGGNHSQVFIGGFSQGGSAAMATYLLYKAGRLGGCVTHSAANLATIDYESEVDLELKRQSEICMYNGGADPTVMPDLCLRTYAILDEH